MKRIAMRPRLAALLVPILLACAGCDIVTADFRSEETAEWRKTYQLAPNGRVEIGNVNGKIDVQPAEGNTVEVVALKKAKGPSPEAAKSALDRITIEEDASADRVKIDTKFAKTTGIFHSGGLQVEYRVKVPVGGIDLAGLKGRINAETTNGGVHARDVAGQIEATTTNGGLDIELARMPEGGVKLECTNGGIKLRLPRDAKATISARITNGGINAGDLPIETSGEKNRRRLDGRLNGGGPRIDIEGTNGGITLAGR
jgi:hypothetical protein